MAAIAVLVFILLLFPFEKIVAPAANIQILGVNGAPAPGLLVEQRWADYSLSNEVATEYKKTDAAGRIWFPKRTRRVPLIWRFLSLILVPLKGAFHMSAGRYSTIIVYGPDPKIWTSQDNTGEPWPQVMQLRQGEGEIRPKVE